MKKEMKLGIGIAVLCISLFILILCIGRVSQKENSELPTEDSEQVSDVTESTESVEDETEGTEVAGSETEGTDDGSANEYVSFAIADVNSYVNVRQEPNTDSDILGKIFDGAVAQIIEVVGEGDNQWFRIISGNVKGYIKAEFFIHGEEAAAVMDQYVVRYARVNVETLNVREGQSTDTDRIGYVCSGERLKVIENCGEWIHIQYTDEIEGYVYAEYVTIMEEYAYAKSPEDEQKEWDYIAELNDRAGVSEEEVWEDSTVTVQPPSPSYTTNSELRQQIVDYAMQFLGDPYIHGGQSLATGTDCSGFTMYVLADFGYSISRTPQGQYTGAGRSISYSEAQPGDIICYSENGSTCSHVAFYIGDGKILHAANPQDGVKISSATYTYVFAVKNVID